MQETRAGWEAKRKNEYPKPVRHPKGRYKELGSQASEWDKPLSVTFKSLTENK